MKENLLRHIVLGLFVFLMIEVILDFLKPSLTGVKNKVKMPSKGDADDPKNVFQTIRYIFGESIAKKAEQIYRLETANFTSIQYHVGRSAGQEAAKDKEGNPIAFPYGWLSLANMWNVNPQYAPTGLDYWELDSAGRKDVYYLKYKDLLSGAMALAEFLKKYGGDVGRWHSIVKEDQERYKSLVKRQPVKWAI